MCTLQKQKQYYDFVELIYSAYQQDRSVITVQAVVPVFLFLIEQDCSVFSTLFFFFPFAFYIDQYRNIEWFRLEGTFEIILVPTPLL